MEKLIPVKVENKKFDCCVTVKDICPVNAITLEQKIISDDWVKAADVLASGGMRYSKFRRFFSE